MVQPTPDSTPPCPPPIPAPATAHSPAAAADRLVFPEVEEYAEVTKRMVETGTVRITKHVHDVERTFQPTLQEQQVRVERVPVNRVLKNPPDIRTEGNTTIIPVVEEVMVKLLILREELHVTRESVRKPADPQHVSLRREQVSVERLNEKTNNSQQNCPPGARPE